MVFPALLLESLQVLAFQKVQLIVCNRFSPSMSYSLDVCFHFQCLLFIFARLVYLLLKCSFFVFNPLTVDKMDLERKVAKQLLLRLNVSVLAACLCLATS